MAGGHRIDGQLHGEGIRAADDQLLGEPDHHQAGDSATITATAASPQNRPLTYTYSASAGNGDGNRRFGDILFDGRTDGPGFDHLQRG